MLKLNPQITVALLIYKTSLRYRTNSDRLQLTTTKVNRPKLVELSQTESAGLNWPLVHQPMLWRILDQTETAM